MTNLKIYTDRDINLDLIKTKKIAIIGFGSQGYGQGMNLVDSGCDVVFGLREEGSSWIKAKDYGLNVMPISEAVKWGIAFGSAACLNKGTEPPIAANIFKLYREIN